MINGGKNALTPVGQEKINIHRVAESTANIPWKGLNIHILFKSKYAN